MQMAKYARMLTVSFAHSARRRDSFSSHRLIIPSSTALRAMLALKGQQVVTLSRVAAAVADAARGAGATQARMAESQHNMLSNQFSNQSDKFSSEPDQLSS